ncbi:hypothetical protein AGMMS50229_18760 [Campylobacterota bacterium]|nr:hypothetical protein AGMMS50229_18760 [Campylobacterota bacterium]
MHRRKFLNRAITVVATLLVGCGGAKKSDHAAAETAEVAEANAPVMEDGIGLNEPKDHLTTEPLANAPKPIVAAEDEMKLLRSVGARLNRVSAHIGYGHFNTIGFDAMRSVAASASKVGKFTSEELDYIEALFYRDAKDYGFFGRKVSEKLTETVDPKTVFKVPYSGHYLYKGQSAEVYDQVKKDIGESITLTSGVRGIPKQLQLFLSKTIECGGNYSEASRSLAPAGYSYHGIGDFDVGKVGYGERNFTQDFEQTHEYELLTQLGYVAIRYPRGNPFGVYFEPWHVEVV